MIICNTYESAVGRLLLGDYCGKLCLCDWHRGDRLWVRQRVARGLGCGWAIGEETPLLREIKRQLDEYFAGARWEFDIEMQLCGTEFQQRVWTELLNIGYGQTMTYGVLAAEMGMPKAVRAVAAAARANALSIIIPCHRLVGNGGALTGYAGGIEAKRKLLSEERRVKREE